MDKNFEKKLDNFKVIEKKQGGGVVIFAPTPELRLRFKLKESKSSKIFVLHSIYEY